MTKPKPNTTPQEFTQRVEDTARSIFAEILREWDRADKEGEDGVVHKAAVIPTIEKGFRMRAFFESNEVPASFRLPADATEQAIDEVTKDFARDPQTGYLVPNKVKIEVLDTQQALVRKWTDPENKTTPTLIAGEAGPKAYTGLKPESKEEAIWWLDMKARQAVRDWDALDAGEGIDRRKLLGALAAKEPTNPMEPLYITPQLKKMRHRTFSLPVDKLEPIIARLVNELPKVDGGLVISTNKEGHLKGDEVVAAALVELIADAQPVQRLPQVQAQNKRAR